MHFFEDLVIGSWSVFGAWCLEFGYLLLASSDRREDTEDIALFEYLFLLSMNPVNQNDLGDLFGYFEPR